MELVPGLVGKRFGHWVVLAQLPKRHFRSGRSESVWQCRCACGTEREVLGASLRSGKSTCCGCVQYAELAKRQTKHGLPQGALRRGRTGAGSTC